MAAAAPLGVVDAIGVISGIFGIVSFSMEQIHAKINEGAQITIKAGMWDRDSDGHKANKDEGGSIDKIWAYDRTNTYMGYTKGGHMDNGGVLDVTIDAKSNGLQSEYIGLLASDDGVCIQWINVRQYDQVMRNGVWTGDIGAHCPGGRNWYYSTDVSGYVKVPGKESNSTSSLGKDYRSKCMWVDGKNDPAEVTTLKFNVEAYGENVTDVQNTGTQCEYTLYRTDGQPIEDQPGPTPMYYPNDKRDTATAKPKPRKQWMQDTLIVSKASEHTAEELCSSQNSWGPDMIGSDGKYCDMDKHEVHPLCDTEQVAGCIKLDKDNKVVTKRSSIGRRSVDQQHKAFKKMQNWG